MDIAQLRGVGSRGAHALRCVAALMALALALAIAFSPVPAAASPARVDGVTLVANSVAPRPIPPLVATFPRAVTLLPHAELLVPSPSPLPARPRRARPFDGVTRLAGRALRIAMLALAGVGPVRPKPDVPISAPTEARAEERSR